MNQKALELLDQAGINYPETKDEALRMKSLLAQALKEAEDPEDPSFKERYDELNEIVKWSLTKHKTWKWPVIIAAVLFALLPLWGSLSDNDTIKKIKEDIKTIKAWEPCDTVITWENCYAPETDAERDNLYKKSYDNANNWIAYKLGQAKMRYLQNEKDIAKYKQNAETEVDSEKKAGLLNQVKNLEEYNKKYQSEFDELSPLRGKEVNKEALRREKHLLGSYRTERTLFFFIFLFVLLFAGLYIWTGNPYGYEISKSRTRHKILGWIQKAGFWLAGICLGTGVAAQLFADDKIVEYVYTNGRRETRREADIAGTSMNVMWKIFLIVIGVIIFFAVAGLVMFLETAFGLPAKIREVKQG